MAVDTKSNNIKRVSRLVVNFTASCQSVCLRSDIFGYVGRGGYGEHGDARAPGGPRSRRRTVLGRHRASGAHGPGVSHRPDAQTLAAHLQHPWRAEEEEEGSQQSAQTSS